VLSPELATFAESGVSLLVGTRDSRLMPEATRAVGARVEAGGAELTVFLADATGADTLANVRDNGRIAVCFSRVDHRSIQVKGTVLSVREAAPAEREIVERYNDLLTASWGQVGIPARLLRRWQRWPCHAVRLRIESVFVQTPGPGAGAPLGATERVR
jgi:hypothetical protein